MTQLPDTTTEAGQRAASVMLARVMGELSECTCGTPGCTVGMRIDSGHGWFVTQVHNLYAPANMALAWRVLNWAFSNIPGNGGHRQQFLAFFRGIVDFYEAPLLSMPPAEAQRAWLDKILTLAIEAGMLP